MYRFIVNVRDRGRCHLVSQAAMALPKEKRRSVCGWRFGFAASLTITKTSKWGSVCRRCFPKGVIEVPACSEPPIEPIEQFQ